MTAFSSPLHSRCPRCGEDAPLVYKDFVPHCAACGALRAPLAAPAVAMAGKPSQVGGTLARVFGWLILGSGGLFSALVFALLAAFFPGSAVAWVVTAPMLLITIAFTFLFVQSGKALGKSGEKTEESVRRKALDAIARQRNGVVTAEDVAGMLRMDVAMTDTWLTDLAKKDPEHVELEVDDNGRITYRFLAYAPDKWRFPVDAYARTQVQAAMPGAGAAAAPHARVAPLNNVVDAEFVEDEPSAGKRRSL